MSRWARRAIVGALVCLGLATTVATAWAQQPPTQPFGPEWGMLAGWDVYVKKGCGKCHSLRGFGGKVGPDLGRSAGLRSFFEIGAAMWNHLPRMGARMREAGVDRPTLTPRELSDLIAFLFTAKYYDEQGDPKAGEKLFAAKGCVQCHEVGGAGGRVGPRLDPLKRANSPVLVAAAMWNHGPQMAETMKAGGIPRPAFTDKEMVDLIAYVVTAAKDPREETAQVVPGTPERGEQLFQQKSCIVCHAVNAQGGTVGPDLGEKRHHISLTRFAALMWNHGPTMWGKMDERGIPFPQLTGQEMADILAYLFTSHYFDTTASVTRGERLLRAKGCLTCHSVRGKGGTVAADFATSNVVGSTASVVAAMWNHSARMEAHVERQAVAWPLLNGQDLADITAYLTSLRPPSPKPRQ